MPTFSLAVSFLRYFFGAVSAHGLHSPFMYRLMTEAVGCSTSDSQVQAPLALRRQLLGDRSLIEVDDLASPLIQEEIFGPVLIIERFTDEAEAIHRSNATDYGLAASVWTSDMLKARRVAFKIRSGNVWMNAHNRLFAEIETGGYGNSGYGRLHGIEGLNDFLQTKHFYFETR